MDQVLLISRHPDHFCLPPPLLRTLVTTWNPLVQDNLPIPRFLITSAKSPRPCDVTYSQVPEIMKTWTLGGGIILPPTSSFWSELYFLSFWIIEHLCYLCSKIICLPFFSILPALLSTQHSSLKSDQLLFSPFFTFTLAQLKLARTLLSWVKGLDHSWTGDWDYEQSYFPSLNVFISKSFSTIISLAVLSKYEHEEYGNSGLIASSDFIYFTR